MKPEYIKNFEHLGMGMFCHFGLYSIIGKGEWHFSQLDEAGKKDYPNLINRFKVKKGWAKELVRTAKDAGCKYITLTTRHHDGFSLYDTCGLNDYDAPHSPTGRDLVKEFVDECRKQGIVPFFYHTLLDWHHPEYDSNFDHYLDYLNKSVEILCRNYGKVGGFWFDGSWSKPDINLWHFEKLYAVIRKYQPEAMIINNTGLSALGEVSHPEIDSVTFERGHPVPVKTNGKEIAGEMCDGITDHWGYAAMDICTKPATSLIESLMECRSFNCNYLINIGPLGNGTVNPVEKYTLKNVGLWIKANKKFIYNVRSAGIEAENARVLYDGMYYYAVTYGIPMAANENVAKDGPRKVVKIHTDKKISGAVWLDNKEKVAVNGRERSYEVKPFYYGTALFARVARFKLK